MTKSVSAKAHFRCQFYCFGPHLPTCKLWSSQLRFLGTGPLRRRSTWTMLVFSTLFSFYAYSFPENVRRGYGNCASCHVSPTGGGLLTPYGDHAAAEFLNTWKIEEDHKAEEAQAAPSFLWGGNVRGLAYMSNNGLFKKKGFIPMQVEGEVAYKFFEKYTAVFSAGVYDRAVQAQRFYLLANFTDHLYARIGKFFPAYGIFTDDHSIVTRKGIGFNEGRETENVEVGLVGELGEIVVDGIVGESSDKFSANEQGATVRAAWYAKGKSQIGASFLSTSSSVWKRTMYGLFAIAGITKSFYVLTEVDQEWKKSADQNEISTPGNTRLLTYNKIGWEFLPGVHSFVTYENSLPTKGAFEPRLWGYGPGVQWFPIEHLEFLAQWQKKYNSFYPSQPGSLATLMLHYYF